VIHIIPNWHPAIVHFTIALYVAAAALYTAHVVAAETRWGEAILTAARVNLWLGALITIVTVAAGIQAFIRVPHSTAQVPPMVDHRNWAIATAAIWWVAALWEAWRARRAARVSAAFAVFLIIGVITLTATGWKGAELVYRHGIGVLSVDAGAADRDGGG
jgi:uncharacterized membrane protein